MIELLEPRSIRKGRGLTIAFATVLATLLLITLQFLFLKGQLIHASPGVHYVAAGGDCGGVSPCHETVQAAVDAAQAGDEILVAAGTYTGVNTYGGLSQVVYVGRTVMIQGGYTITNWITPDPEANPTTLDAQGQGRVLYIEGKITATIEGLQITGGDATGLGGGFWSWMDAGGGVYATEATLTLVDCTLSHNTTRWDGGGLYISYGTATLRESDFSTNTAERYAGGLLFYRSTATLTGNIIADNSGNTYGGLLLLATDATLSDNTIAFNTAMDGPCGGIRLEGGEVALTGNAITNNASDGSGGGLCAANSDATLSHNTITGNLGRYAGGGVRAIRGTLVLTGNIISGNSVAGDTGRGGGMSLEKTDATLVNNFIADNYAGGTGGGLYVRSSSLQVLHTTIARNNSGDGGGIHATGRWEQPPPPAYEHIHIYYGSTLAITNTILVSHTVGLYVTENSTATLEATLWGTEAWANETDWAGAGSIFTGTVNLWGDPAFTNPEAGDYHIGRGSAAIDEGVEAGVIIDIDGEARPIGEGYDIGADELGASMNIAKRAIPQVIQPGGQLTYTIWVTNSGVLGATGVTVTDAVPLNTTFTWASDGGQETGGVVSWTVSSVAIGESVTRTMVVTVDEGLSNGTLIENNEYGVRSEETPAPIMGSPVTTMVGLPVVTIGKGAEPDPVTAGAELTYTLVVTNEGGAEATGVLITDRVPVDTSFSWASEGGQETGGVVSWTVSSVAIGESVTRTMVVTVDEGLSNGTLIENNQYGVRSEETPAPIMGSAVTTLVGVPVLTIGKEAEPDPVRAGAELTYTLVVTNQGGLEATGVVITDRVPVDTSFSWASEGGQETDGVVSWTVPSVGVVESVTRTMVVTVDEGLSNGTLIENNEYGVGSEETPEVVMGSPVTTLVGVPVLTIGKGAEPDPVAAGAELTYTLVVTNEGGAEATGVVITDRVPVDTSFSWASEGGQETSGVVSWTVPSVGVVESVTRTMVVMVDEGLSNGTLIENNEYGVGSEETPEVVMGSPVTTLVGVPVLTIGKGAQPDLVPPGGELTYALVVTNSGGLAAAGLVITDMVPLNTTFAWAGDGGQLIGDEVVWTDVTVGAGETAEVTWRVTVTESLYVQEIINESYGVRRAEELEAVMGESVHTPLLRYERWLPLAMKNEFERPK